MYIYIYICPGSQVPRPPPMVWYPRPGGQQAAKSGKTNEKQGKAMKNKEKQVMCPCAHARMHAWRMHSRAH